jgi:hypothetical protein
VFVEKHALVTAFKQFAFDFLCFCNHPTADKTISRVFLIIVFADLFFCKQKGFKLLAHHFA